MWTALLLAALAAVAGPGDTIEVLTLRHRMADDVVPVLQPLLAPGDALTASRNQLIVRTDPVTLARLRQVLEQIDRAARNLLVTVRSVRREEALQAGASASARITPGDTVGGTDSPGGDGVHVQARALQRDAGSDVINRVRVVEGQEAFISTGQSVVSAPSAHPHAPGSRHYRSTDSGFTVLPRVNGDTVSVQIGTGSERFAGRQGGVVEVQRMDTVISGPLGAWLTIGGIDESSRRDSRGLAGELRGETTYGRASRQHRAGTDGRVLQLRVDLVR